MLHLNITHEENEILIDAIESYLSELRMEISDTDLRDFKEKLKHRRDVLQKVLEALKHSDAFEPMMG